MKAISLFLCMKDPIRLPKHSPVLRLIQQLRDETQSSGSIPGQEPSKKNVDLCSDSISGLGPNERRF